MIRNFIKVRDTVKALLIKHPELRDNDELLILKVNEIFGYAKKERHSKYGVGYFIPEKLLLERKIIKFESIRRVRQKLQEEMPELRGSTYKRRQKEAEYVKIFMERL